MKLDEKNILFEDNHLLIVNKWAGLLSQGDKTGDASLIDMAKAYIKIKYDKPGEVFLGLPHRLDRPTSGAIICCRTSKALTRMTGLFNAREVEKVYHVLSESRPAADSGQIESYIRKNSQLNKVTHAMKPFEGAKKAVLDYRYSGPNREGYHLTEVTLHTGRPHQIRVQMRALGCPVLGDIKYNDTQPLPDQSIGLHARLLKFIHPVRKTPLHIVAPYPEKDWWR